MFFMPWLCSCVRLDTFPLVTPGGDSPYFSSFLCVGFCISFFHNTYSTGTIANACQSIVFVLVVCRDTMPCLMREISPTCPPPTNLMEVIRLT